MKVILRVFLFFLLVTGFIKPGGLVFGSAQQQINTAQEKAVLLLSRMTPAERVGQVFLVTFTGTNADEGSQIFDLIVNKHVGGVVLRASNDNFTGTGNNILDAQGLIRRLQSVKWESLQSDANVPSSSGFIPLFIGISQEGDLYPYDQVLNGLSILPSQMAIGATWDTQYAEKVGLVLGNELSAMGINFFLGPSLDVLDSITTETRENLGVRSFGGDPFWVGKMGKAYIQGIHEGSENRIAVIATHFPGRGSSDRSPEEEIPTVRKTLEQLKHVELVPFFATTGEAEVPVEQVEALLLTHIRYQGFQGNIRLTTKPVSFDAAAVDLILSLPEFSEWRDQGGLIVSDDLSSESVRKFYDPLNTGYDARQIARTALLAGNDLLYLGNIVSSEDEDSYTTIVRTIEYFTQKYQEDNAFQSVVDQAALRILTLKYSLYPQFSQAAVLQDPADLENVGNVRQLVAEIAQDSATLVNPQAEDIYSVIPNPPQFNDDLVFISDQITYKQCSKCADLSIFPASIIAKAVEKFYGTSPGNQIQPTRLKVYSLENIRLLLENAVGTEDILNDLNSAEWIIMAFTDLGQSTPEATIFQRFFDEKPELIRGKKIIGMAFNAPYFLDATDISKLTAYYAFYSKTPPFFETAARVLFQELSPRGDLPVSVSGIGYDLIETLTPDSDQVISLMIESPDSSGQVISTPSSEYSMPLLYKVGDTVPVSTGVILDHNGNPVPDGTIVRFLIDTMSANRAVEQIEIPTEEGIARMTFLIPSIGMLELRATSGPALSSQILRLDITDAGGVVTSIEPTEIPDEPILPSPTPETTPTLASNAEIAHGEGKLTITDWLASTIIILAACLIFNWFTRKGLSLKWNTNITLLMGLGGFVAYAYHAVGFPGAIKAIQETGSATTMLVVLAGLLVGLAVGLVLFLLEKKRKKTNAKG